MLCVTLYSRANSKYKSPGGAYIRRGDLTEGCLRYDFGGLIFGGAYKWRELFSEFYGISLVKRWDAHIDKFWDNDGEGNENTNETSPISR